MAHGGEGIEGTRANAAPMGAQPGPQAKAETDQEDRYKRVERFFTIPVLVAAVLVIPVVAIDSTSIGQPWARIAAYLNWVIWVAFALEFFALLIVAQRRWHWLLHHPLDIAIVFLTPPFLPASLQAIRALRLLRLIRLFRVAQLARKLFSMEGVRYIAVLALLTVLGGGAAFAAVERQRSTWDGVWWSVETMTTVGYGDVVPTTTAGRIIGIVVMLVGVGFVAVLTGAIAQRFLAPDVELIELEIADEADSVTEIQREIRAVRDRLGELETRLQRIGRP